MFISANNSETINLKLNLESQTKIVSCTILFASSLLLSRLTPGLSLSALPLILITVAVKCPHVTCVYTRSFDWYLLLPSFVFDQIMTIMSQQVFPNANFLTLLTSRHVLISQFI